MLRLAISGTLGLMVAALSHAESISWERYEVSSSSVTLYSIHYLRTGEVFLSGDAGTVLHASPQSGWRNFTVETKAPLLSIAMVSPTTGWVVAGAESGANRSLLWKTVNGGLSWSPQNSGVNATLRSVFFLDSNTGFAAGSGGTLIKTVDGGSNWTILPSRVTSQLKSLFFLDTLTGYCVGAGGTLLKTQDGGRSWMVLRSGVTADLNAVYFKSRDTAYVVGARGTILKTVTAGAFWVQQESGTLKNLNAVTHDGTAWSAIDSRSYLDVMHVVGDSGTLLVCPRSSVNDKWEIVRTSPSLAGHDFYAVGFPPNGSGYGLVAGEGGVLLRNWFESPVKAPRAKVGGANLPLFSRLLSRSFWALHATGRLP